MWNPTLKINNHFQTSWKQASLKPMRVCSRKWWAYLNVSTTERLDSLHRWLKGHYTETVRGPVHWNGGRHPDEPLVLVGAAVFKNASLLLEFKEKHTSCCLKYRYTIPYLQLQNKNKKTLKNQGFFSYSFGDKPWPKLAWHHLLSLFILLRINMYTLHCSNSHGFNDWMSPPLGDRSRVTFLTSEKF